MQFLEDNQDFIAKRQTEIDIGITVAAAAVGIGLLIAAAAPAISSVATAIRTAVIAGIGEAINADNSSSRKKEEDYLPPSSNRWDL